MTIKELMDKVREAGKLAKEWKLVAPGLKGALELGKEVIFSSSMQFKCGRPLFRVWLRPKEIHITRGKLTYSENRVDWLLTQLAPYYEDLHPDVDDLSLYDIATYILPFYMATMIEGA